MWTAPPLVGSALARTPNRRQPPFQYVKKVVPNSQTFSGATALALTAMRASVGCIQNRIPEGFNRKSLRTTAETELRLCRVVCTGTSGSLGNAGAAAGAIAVAKYKTTTEITDRVMVVC